MKVGTGFIVDRRHARVSLRNGEKPEVDWYLFRIPIREYIKNQLQEDYMEDQISLKEYIDPFTGEPVEKGK